MNHISLSSVKTSIEPALGALALQVNIIPIYIYTDFLSSSGLQVNVEAVGVVGRGRAPVREDGKNADLLPEGVENGVDVTIALDKVLDGAVVVVTLLVNLCHGRRAVQRPGDDLEAQLLGLLGVVARHQLAILDGDEVRNGRGNDLDTVLSIVGQVGGGGFNAGGLVAALVEEDGLVAKGGLLLQEVFDVAVEEALDIGILGGDGVGLELVDNLLNVLFLGVVAVKGHFNHGGLDLGGELEAEGADEGNVLLEGHDLGACGVEIGAPGGRAVEVVGGVGGGGVGAVHLGAQRLVLVERDVAGAALSLGGLAVGGRLEGRLALGVELGDVDNVGRGVQIALAVTADELTVLGKGHIALLDARAHAGAGHDGLARLLGDLECAAAAVTNGPGRGLHGLLRAGQELGLEGPLGESVNEVVGARAELDLLDGLDDVG